MNYPAFPVSPLAVPPRARDPFLPSSLPPRLLLESACLHVRDMRRGRRRLSPSGSEGTRDTTTPFSSFVGADFSERRRPFLLRPSFMLECLSSKRSGEGGGRRGGDGRRGDEKEEQEERSPLSIQGTFDFCSTSYISQLETIFLFSPTNLNASPFYIHIEPIIYLKIRPRQTDCISFSRL
jgi:hypothetical protein